MTRGALRNLLIETIKNKFGNNDIPDFSVGIPDNEKYGDYASNIALILAKNLKKNPMDVAAVLVAELRKKTEFNRVEVAPPGFINFWVADKALEKEFGEILKKKDSYGKLKVDKSRHKVPTSLLKDKNSALGEKINLEFISANPTGPLTIGNGRGAFFGDALSRILEFAGRKVTREYYINDARASNQIQELGKTILGRGESYKGKYADEIKKRLKKKFSRLAQLEGGRAGHLAAQEIQKDNRKFIEKKLKINFDVWYSEEALYKKGLVRKTIEELKNKNLIYEKDGALWFRSSRFGDSEDRVAVRSGGEPTYFLPDVAYHVDKLTKRKFNRVLDILGADHHGTFSRVLAGLEAIGIDKNKVGVIFIQMVRLVRGGQEVKMSKRRGEFVTLEELVDEVGLDAARYFFLEKSPDTHMDFDMDLAKERSMKNPVYYLQYAFVRCGSILKKVQSSKFKIQSYNSKIKILENLSSVEERKLIKKLIQFPDVLEDIAKDYQIHRLTRYAQELAAQFHNFYEKHRVITDDKELTRSRLLLVKSTQIVLRIILDLLGLNAPSRM